MLTDFLLLSTANLDFGFIDDIYLNKLVTEALLGVPSFEEDELLLALD